MEALSVRDYRNNLAESFERAADGERVLIRRKNSIFALVCVGNEDISLSTVQQHQLDKAEESIRRAWNQVKQIEAGRMPSRSATDFLDEL